MYITFQSTLALFLALSSSVEPAATRLTHRTPFYFGWHATTKVNANQMQAAGTMLYLGNGEETNQLGPGVYLSEKLGDWPGEVVCLFAVDKSKITSADKVKYPHKNKAGKGIQWLWTNFEGQKQGKSIKDYFTDVGADMKTSLRLSDWDNGIQLKVPETMCGKANPLGITIVECSVYSEKDKMKNKDVVVDYKSWPGWKGWLDSESVPAGEKDAACLLETRDGTTGSGCSSQSSSSSSISSSHAQTVSSTSRMSSSKATIVATTTKPSVASKPTASTKPKTTP